MTNFYINEQTAGGHSLTFDDDGNFEIDGTPVGLGAPVVRGPFPFAFDSEGILNPGFPLYTPAPGDWLLDAWMTVDTPWDGTTPTGDFGSFLGGPTGIFKNLNGPIDMTIGDAETIDDTLVSQGGGSTQASDAVQQGIYKNDQRYFPARWNSADPIRVVVSQDGTAGGSDPASTQGAGSLYLVTVTPAS